VAKMTFETVETEVLELEFNYGQTNKKCVQDLIINTENALRQLDTKLFIALAHKKTSQIKNWNSINVLHKWQSHIIRQICRKLIKIIITKADTSRTVVIIHKDAHQHKVQTFVKEKHFTEMYNDPTDVYQTINTIAVHYISLKWNTSYASAGQAHIGSNIAKDVCFINSYSLAKSKTAKKSSLAETFVSRVTR